MKVSRYALANEATDILTVLGLIGMPVPEISYLASMKLYCPFGDVSHADGGMSKAFRVYPETNSAYCFACALAFTPVSLLAMGKDISKEEAADFLLELAGVTEANSDERWAQLTAPEPVTINTAELAEALKLFCRRTIPNWEERQFEPAVAKLFQRCLGLLGSVRTPEDAEQWLAATKQAMITKQGDDRVRQTVR